MKPLALCLAACLALAAASTLTRAEEPAPSPSPAAEGGGEHGEAKKGPPPKPKPDSAVSTILQLPVVRKWDEWVTAKNDGSDLEVWGEALNHVGDYACWGVAVGVNGKDGMHVWKRFCVQKTGIEIWVESTSADDQDDVTYMTYDDWLGKCHPTENSAGKC